MRQLWQIDEEGGRAASSDERGKRKRFLTFARSLESYVFFESSMQTRGVGFYRPVMEWKPTTAAGTKRPATRFLSAHHGVETA